MKTRFLYYGFCLTLLFMLAACSNGGEMRDLLDKIPEEADIVIVGDVKTVLESAGAEVEGSKIKLPDYLANELPSNAMKDWDELQSFLSNSGIKVEAGAFALSYNEKKPIFIFALLNLEKFVRTLEEEGFNESSVEEDITYYEKKTFDSSYDQSWSTYSYVAVKDGYAYFVDNVWGSDAIQVTNLIGKFTRNAEEASFADTRLGKYIAAKNVFGMSIHLPRELRAELRETGVPSNLANFYSGYVCMTGNLSEDRAEFKFKMFDEDGKPKDAKEWEQYMDINAKINPEALAYLGPDEFLVSAGTLKGFKWDSYMEMFTGSAQLSRSDQAALSIIKSYLKRLDGTIAFGMGLSNGTASIFDLENEKNISKALPMTLVLETKAGKAQDIVNELKSLMEKQQLNYEDKPNGFTFSIPEGGLTLYMEAKGDILVASNQPIQRSSGNPTVKEVNFKDYFSAMALVLKSNNPVLRDLGIQKDLKMQISVDPSSMEILANLEITGDNSVGVIGKVIKAMLAAANHIERIEDTYRQNRNSDAYPGSDSMEADSTIDTSGDYAYADSIALPA